MYIGRKFDQQMRKIGSNMNFLRLVCSMFRLWVHELVILTSKSDSTCRNLHFDKPICLETLNLLKD